MELKSKLKFSVDRKVIENILFVAFLTFIGLYARVCLFSHESGDYHQFLLPWHNQLKENGGFAAVGMDIGDYMPTYYYILALLTYLPLEPLVGIKIVSCIADLLLAFFGYKIVRELTGSVNKGIVAYGVLFFMPSVILNSGAWAQCDAIFSMFIVAAIYCLIKDRDWAAAICFSVSFVFKIQAIFFAPVLLILLLKKKIRWRTVLALPGVYLISIIPACIAGGDFVSLLTVYSRQSTQYTSLNMYIQNVWGLLLGIDRVEKKPALASAGVYFAGGVVLVALFCMYRAKYKITGKAILTLSGLFTLLVPFVLPHMHERYYYLTAVITAIFVVVNIKKIWMFLIIEFCLFQAEAHNLYGKDAMDFNFSVLMVAFVLVWYFKAMYEMIKEQEIEAAEQLEQPTEAVAAELDEQEPVEAIENEAEEMVETVDVSTVTQE